MTAAVAEVVSHQHEIGVDVVGDGECSHMARGEYDFSSWRTYVFERVSGLELVEGWVPPKREVPAGQVVLGAHAHRRDWIRFSDAYSDPSSGVALPNPEAYARVPVCRGPVAYRGQEHVQRDIGNFRSALAAVGMKDGFMNAVSPASFARFGNEYYATDEELLFACADAMREEYAAIIDAGLMLQLDDPAIADSWDQVNPEPSIEAYKAYTRIRIEALNHAIRALPQERIRFHLCWGSWHGPHTTDVPMADIVDLMLSVNAGHYSFEAANVRHEHEWRVWETTELPDGKVIMPGVVSHATNVVEHPELVADRICRFAERVGRERVIASTDCGLGGRVHEQIAWAKLEALVEGAKLATERLWG
ncbi:MAG TPA: cobalamin-independent methionine synthase II family protein [Solirubrobacteraceae bacterium]|nr:cobalamin-independent methionine synthase II family protein [Solirubrobacteraceae bacterium]